MRFAITHPAEILRAATVGLLVAIGTGLVTVPLFKSGIAPMPEAPSLAFAKTLFGPVADSIGLVFHVGYVTGITTLALMVVGARPSAGTVAGIAALLYVIAVGAIFPVVGWGFAGLAITPKIAVAAIGPHVLYALVLWGADRVVFGRRARGGHALA